MLDMAHPTTLGSLLIVDWAAYRTVLTVSATPLKVRKMD
jgi:hypothetical protein